MRYAAALVLVVFAVGNAGAANDSAAECRAAGMRLDYDAMVTPCTKAAEQDYFGDQLNLGILYAEGKGVPKDVVRAVMWLTLAAARDPVAAAARDIIRKRMTREQIAEAQRMASEWFEKFKAKQDGD